MREPVGQRRGVRIHLDEVLHVRDVGVEHPLLVHVLPPERAVDDRLVHRQRIGQGAGSPDARRLDRGLDRLRCHRRGPAGQGGGAPDNLCLGLALVAQKRFAPAAGAFEAAAKADAARDPLEAAQSWAQAGNAWLAAGDAVKARTALDAALASGSLTGLQRGEAQLDRARSLVAAQQLAAARIDLDAALKTAGEDPLAWLLSATLARRMQDVPRATSDIAEALRLAPDAPQVHLEAGNIAAAAGEAERAQAAWKEAARLAPDAPAGRSAANALTQFAGDPKK